MTTIPKHTSDAISTLCELAAKHVLPHYERDRPPLFSTEETLGCVDWHDVLKHVLSFARRVDDRDCADDLQVRARICFPAGLHQLPPSFATATSAYDMSTLAMNRDGETLLLAKDDRINQDTVSRTRDHDDPPKVLSAHAKLEHSLWSERHDRARNQSFAGDAHRNAP